MENLLIFYEVYKNVVSFFLVQSGGYHYYFKDLIRRGNKRMPRNPERLFKKRLRITVGYRTLMKDTFGRKRPPINSGMFWVRRDWMISRLITDDTTGRELFKELEYEL